MNITIIDKKVAVDGISDTFEITSQVTITALGLEPEDQVTIWLTLLSEPLKGDCPCPPAMVQLPQVLDEVQLTCCGTPVVLSRQNPFVVLDAPQGIKLRAKLNSPVLTTQRVLLRETTSKPIGCQCEA